ncbi:MAG: dTMP kinase [Methanomicrobiales archaeon]|nr:dTMP kinase [Methanomicrobiales archaeon]
MQRTGKLIVIEGADGSGKTTQVRLLAERLGWAGIPCLTTAEPTRAPDPVGGLIRTALTGGVTIRDPRAMQLLYAADRLEHAAAVIEPALRRGELVICDRYDLSTLVYMCAGTPEGRCACGWSGDVEMHSVTHGIRFALCGACGEACSWEQLEVAAWLRDVGKWAPRPDATIVLDVPHESAAARRGHRGGEPELFEKAAFQDRCCKLYGQASRLLPCGDRVFYVDASRSAEDVSRTVFELVSEIWRTN